MAAINAMDALLLRIDVRQRYDALQAALEAFAASILADKHLPAQLPEADGMAARYEAAAAYRKFFPDEEQGQTNTFSCLGALGASEETLRLAAAVNDCKEAFKTAMAPTAKRKAMENGERLDMARVLLREIHLGGLLQRQVTRAIPLLARRPLYLGYTETERSHSVERITLHTARLRLERLGDGPHIEGQLTKLSNLDREILAVVLAVAKHVRVNVREQDDSGGIVKYQRKWQIPVLYPAAAGDPPLAIRWPTPPKAETLSHGRRKIEPEVFLPSIKAHRYLEALRAEVFEEFLCEEEGKEPVSVSR